MDTRRGSALTLRTATSVQHFLWRYGFICWSPAFSASCFNLCFRLCPDSRFAPALDFAVLPQVSVLWGSEGGRR